MILVLAQGNQNAVLIQLHHFALVLSAVFRPVKSSVPRMVAVLVQNNFPEPVPALSLIAGHGDVVNHGW